MICELHAKFIKNKKRVYSLSKFTISCIAVKLKPCIRTERMPCMQTYWEELAIPLYCCKVVEKLAATR